MRKKEEWRKNTHTIMHRKESKNNIEKAPHKT